MFWKIYEKLNKMLKNSKNFAKHFEKNIIEEGNNIEM